MELTHVPEEILEAAYEVVTTAHFKRGNPLSQVIFNLIIKDLLFLQESLVWHLLSEQANEI